MRLWQINKEVLTMWYWQWLTIPHKYKHMCVRQKLVVMHYNCNQQSYCIRGFSNIQGRG